MINTLLEHVPIKMEVQETVENNGITVNRQPQNDGLAQDVENPDETDEEVITDGSEVEDGDEEDVDEEEDEEESDIETDALEIEKEATMLISSDEEAELEAQRIRFPELTITKKSRRDSNISLASSSRSSQTSSFCSQPHITYEIVKRNDCTMEATDNKKRNSPRLKHMENTHSESYNKENNSTNNKSMLKQKTENKNLENSNKSLESSKTKSEESSKHLDNNKTPDGNKTSENNRKKENYLKSPPVNACEQKSRRGSSNSTCSVASTVASDSAETESCGNIYVFNLEQKLIFNCELCDLKYGDLDNFGLHLHEAHKLFNIDEDPEKENAPRNLGKNSRQAKSTSKNCISVKKEPLQCAEQKAEPPIALPPSALAEPLDSCGNVFMLNHRKLFLVCGYCESKYANLEVFEKHLRQQHRIFEGCHNEVNVVPKVEVKEEVLAVSETVNVPDIIPQAMVAIPAEIPLNITAENEQQIRASSADAAAVVKEPAAQKHISKGETTTAVAPRVADSKEKSASDGIAADNVTTVVAEVLKLCADQDKVQKSTQNIAEQLPIVKASVVEIKEKSKDENKVKPIIQKSSIKRPSSTDKESESPNKRQKKRTRNNTRVEQESPAPTETGNRSATKASETDRVVEKGSSTNPPKTVETTDNSSSITLPETTKETAVEVESLKECVKSANDTTRKKSPTRKTTKTPELERNTSVKLPDIRKTREPHDTAIIPVKLVQAVETRQAAGAAEKKTTMKLTNTRETRKRKDPEPPAATKSIEIKKPGKAVATEKKPSADLVAARGTGKITTTVSVLPQSKEARKAKQSVKAISTKVDYKKTKLTATSNIITKGTRKTREVEKQTLAVLTGEARETRTTAKRTAGDNLAAEVVELKKPAMVNTEKHKPAISTESKKFDDKKKAEIKKYQCSICYKEFTRRRTLILHESTAHPAGFRKIYGCGICNQGFLDEDERKTHMFQRHNAHIYFDCNLCFRAYSAKSDLERHNEEVHEVKIYKCGECLRTYCSERSLKAHLYTYHNAAMKRAIAKNRKNNSGQKLILTTTIEKEPLPEAAESDVKDEVKLNLSTTIAKEALQTAAVKEDVNGKTASLVVAAQASAASSTMIYAIDNINTKPIDIIDVQLSNVQLANLTEINDTYGLNSTSNNTEQIIYVADLNGESDNHEMVMEIPSENTALKVLPIECKDTTKSLAPTAVQFGSGYEQDDRTADPVNDIIAQLQNELSESTSSETSNMVTYTINALPNTEETPKAAVLSSVQLNDVEKTEDVKPTFLKIIKHFVCDVCPKTYSKHSRLIEHKRLHTGEKPFSCGECGKHFRTRNRLNEHKQRHSKERNFKCEVCLLSFVTRNDFTLHMRHHNNDRRHKCPVCGKAFVRSSDLKIHERIHTGEKPYVCDVCNKRFRANQNLSVHKKSHMGDVSKTFQCEHCDKKFMRKIDRKVHMRTHTGERPFKCEICQRAYSSRVNVRAHIDRDHVKGGNEDKKKPGPKTRSLIAELERQKKLIEELQNQLLQQVKKDENVTLSDEEMQAEHILPDSHIKVSSPIAIPPNSAARNDIVQSAFNLMVDKLKASSSTADSPPTTSKSLTIIPSPPLLDEPSSPSPPPPLIPNAANDSTTTLLPLTLTQAVDQAAAAVASSLCLATTTKQPSSPIPPTTDAAAAATSCLVKASTQPTTMSPSVAASAAKTTSAKVVSQKTSLGGIQQVSVTVSMQVENVTTNPSTADKDDSEALTTSPSDGASGVKKERKITSYFSVLDQKSKG